MNYHQQLQEHEERRNAFLQQAENYRLVQASRRAEGKRRFLALRQVVSRLSILRLARAYDMRLGAINDFRKTEEFPKVVDFS
jgi:hypothetical protein